MKTIPLRTGLCCSLLGVAGCNLLVPFIFLHPGTKKVPPEYARLDNTKTVVLVWAEPETMYDYPHVRLEVASYVGDAIAAGVEGVQLVNERKVEEYVQRNPEAAVDPRAVGEHFEADRVVYLELLEFQIRDPESPDLLQGKVRAAVRVYDLTTDVDELGFQELEEVALVYPEQAVLYTLTAPVVIRNEAYKQTAQMVARKFYEHDEKM